MIRVCLVLLSLCFMSCTNTPSANSTSTTPSPTYCTRTVYSGTLGAAPQNVAIAEATTNDMVSISVYLYSGGFWTLQSDLFAIQEGSILHNQVGNDGKPYKIVVIK